MSLALCEDAVPTFSQAKRPFLQIEMAVPLLSALLLQLQKPGPAPTSPDPEGMSHYEALAFHGVPKLTSVSNLNIATTHFPALSTRFPIIQAAEQSVPPLTTKGTSVKSQGR